VRTASSWHSGRVVPALRHWSALAALAAVEVPFDPPGAEVVTFEKATDLREQCADDAMHELAGVALAREEVEPESEAVAAVVAVVR